MLIYLTDLACHGRFGFVSVPAEDTHFAVRPVGSHGATAVPLLVTLLAWGKDGVAQRLDHSMALCDALFTRLAARKDLTVFAPPDSGVLLWRPKKDCSLSTDEVYARLPDGAASLTTLGGERWLRHVAANPNASIEVLWAAIEVALKAPL